MLTSIFFGIAFLGAYTGIYFCKKTEKVLNGIAWLCTAFIILLCYQSLAAGILSLLGVRINLISVGASDLALCMVFIFLYSKGVIRRQRYSYTIKDGIIIAILLFCVIFKFIGQFGVQLNIHYITSDPSVHLFQAMEVINSGEVKKMYFASLLNALFMEFMEPVFSGFFAYKSFILMEGIMLFISGLSLFSVMRQKKVGEDNKMIIPDILFLLMYVLAYPLNNMVFGFAYLGMSVSIIAVIIVVVNLYMKPDSNEQYCKLVLMLLCLGVAISYILFAPVIYITIFVCLSYKYFRKDKVKIKKWIIDNLLIFLIPCILVVVYCFFGMFSADVQSIGDGIQDEGFVYKDIFMNAWLIILPVFVGLFSFIKKKKICAETVGFVLLTAFMALVGAGGLKGIISSYYFYKLTYVMSLFLYAIGYEGVVCWSKESMRTLLGYCSSIILIFTLFFTEFEDWISEKNDQFISYNKLPVYLDIYEFNDYALEMFGVYNHEKMALYQTIYEEYDENVICIGEWLDCYWYEALTNQRIDPERFYPWEISRDKYWNNIAQDKSLKHLLVLKDSEIYKENKKRFENLKIDVENEQGIIFSLDEAGRKQLTYGE